MRDKRREIFLVPKMSKLKPLLPSLRERKRYIAYEMISEQEIEKDVSNQVLENIRNTLGLFDSANAGILSVEYDEKRQEGILRTSHDSVNKVRTALALLQELDGHSVVPRVKGVSGNLKKARNKYMN